METADVCVESTEWGVKVRSGVDTTDEDRAHYATMLQGNVGFDSGDRVRFFTRDGRDHRVLGFGPEEIFYVDDVFGKGNKEGVVGRVAREAECNAVSFGSSSYVRGASGFSIECTPFSVYKVKVEPEEDSGRDADPQ